MTIEEAEKNGCPKYVLNKLKRAGVSEVRWGSSWEQLAKDADVLYYKTHPEKMFFGKKLKEVRLDAKMGLRKISEKMDMLASAWCDIERGYAKHPSHIKLFLATFKNAVEETTGEDLSFEVFKELYELALEPFVMQKMPLGGMPVFPCTTDGKPMTDEKMRDFCEYMKTYFEEHNAKADAYNKEHGVG